MDENTPAGENVGAAVSATDADGDTLTYSISGTDASSFGLDTSTGQIQTSAALDHERKSAYSVTLGVTDNKNSAGNTDPSIDDTIIVTINVTNVPPPGTPDAPTVTASSSSSLTVDWDAPTNTGPAINDYDVRYRVSGSGSFDDAGYNGETTETTITGLSASTTYEVQVRATNPEGTSDWSDSGTGTTTLAKPVLDVSPLPQRKATLTWAAVTNANGYVVEIREHGETAWSPQTSQSDTSYEIVLDNILAGKGLADAPYAFEFRVVAKDSRGAYGDSEYSEVVTIIDTPIYGVDGHNSSDTSSNAGQAVIKWKTPTPGRKSDTPYKIRYRKMLPSGGIIAHTNPSWSPGTYGDYSDFASVTGSQTSHSITNLEIGEIYGVQLMYEETVTRNKVYAARDAYVWVSTDFPANGSRVATYPFFGHWPGREYKYIICTDTFPRTSRTAWVGLIVDAFEQWEEATNGFVTMTRDENRGCADSTNMEQFILDDDQLNEVRMFNLDEDTGGQSIYSFSEFTSDAFKFCIVQSPACVTSFTGYSGIGSADSDRRRIAAIVQAFRDGTNPSSTAMLNRIATIIRERASGHDRQASNVLRGVDVSFRKDAFDSTKIENPRDIRFNTCRTRAGTPQSADNAASLEGYFAYATALHEAGHALGLSNIDPDNIFAPQYRAAHPTITDSVMNHDGEVGESTFSEPDCSPYPFDLMAIYALYQAGLADRVGPFGGRISEPRGIAWVDADESVTPSVPASLYMVDDATDALYKVENPRRSAATTKVGDLRTKSGTRITSPRGLAWDGAKDDPTLYMLTPTELYTLDKDTGIATPVGTLGTGIIDASGLAWRRSHLTDSDDANARLEGRLYMVDRATDKLYVLDTDDGRSTFGLARHVDRSTVQFGATITNPAGIEWVGSDLYMVAPVGSESIPSPSALYKLDPTTGEATILGALGVVDPTDIAWDKDGSTMYLIDNDSDALYTVRQIQAPSPPIATGTEHIGKLTRLDRTGSTISAPRGLAFVGSMLYMVDDNTDSLYTVDTTTGFVTQVGSATTFGIVDANGQAVADVSPRGLAWDGTNLYMMTNDKLYTLSTTTGIATLVGRLIVGGTQAGPSDPFGLAYAYGGEFLYMVNRGDSPALYRMSKLGNVYRVASSAIDRFQADVSNPTGLAWNGNTLYTSNITSDGSGVLYTVDKGTGIATRVEALGIDNPTDLAWDSASSTLYVVDDDTDSLYKVNDLLRSYSYVPNAGDLYYNGGNFADAFMRWDNPSWSRVKNCNISEDLADTDCSTYEHDLELEWDNPDSQGNPGGWFTVPSTRLPRSVENRLGFSTSLPGYRISYRGLSVTVPYAPPGFPDRVYIPILIGSIIELVPVNLNPLPEDLFCTTWSDLPNPYDDCHTAGLFETRGKIVLSLGTYKANLIEAGRDYYGYWSFNNQRGAVSTTEVKTKVNLYGQEGRFGEDPDASLLKRAIARTVCPRITVSKWCVFGIDGRQAMLSPDEDEDGSTWEWTHRTSFYDSYYRR